MYQTFPVEECFLNSLLTKNYSIMKHFMILLVVFTLTACHHSMEPWPSDGDRQDVPMYVCTRSLSGITPFPTTYQFLIFNKENAKFSRFSTNPDPNNPNQMFLKLLPGNYTGYCLTGGEEEDSWIFEENLPPEKIFLKAQKNSKSHNEAKDHLLGTQEFSVNETNEVPVIFDLNRKVGMLRVRIENIPEWMTDLQINLSNIPKQMNLSGEYSGNYTVTKNITIPENGVSETDLLVFPPQGNDQAILTLFSNSLVFITPEHPIESIQANQITEIKAVFQEAATPYQVNFTNRLVEWETPVNREEDWKIDPPEKACTGTGNGTELVLNGSFEEKFFENIPAYWILDAAAKEYPRTAISVTSPVQEGNKAVLIEGKTYIYQDIPIVGGKCYQLHLYINAPHSDARWKCYSTWRKGSTSLSSNQLQSSVYEGKTNGYINFYENKIFRAPSDANKLRIEIRNYNDPVSGQGIYIDAVSVQAID